MLSPWELRDVPQLVSALRRGLHEGPYPDDVPYTVRDPEYVLEQLDEALVALEHPAVVRSAGGPAAATTQAPPAAVTEGASFGGQGSMADEQPPPARGALLQPGPSLLTREGSGGGCDSTAPGGLAAAAAEGGLARITVRFARDEELPPLWLLLREQQRQREEMQREQSPGAYGGPGGSTALGTTMDTAEQTAETDPVVGSMGVAAPRSATLGATSRPVSKKVAKLKKGLGLA